MTAENIIVIPPRNQTKHQAIAHVNNTNDT